MALGDVACVEDETAHGVVGQEVGGRAFHIPQISVLPPEPVLDPGHRVGVLDQLVPHALDSCRVVGMDEIRELPPEHVRGLQSEHRFDRCTLVPDPPLVVEHGDEVGGALHERSELRRLLGPGPA